MLLAAIGMNALLAGVRFSQLLHGFSVLRLVYLLVTVAGIVVLIAARRHLFRSYRP